MKTVTLDDHIKSINTDKKVYFIADGIAFAGFLYGMFLIYTAEGHINTVTSASLLALLLVFFPIGIICITNKAKKTVTEIYSSGIKLKGYVKLVRGSRNTTSCYFSDMPDFKNIKSVLGWKCISVNTTIKCTVLSNGKRVCLCEVNN